MLRKKRRDLLKNSLQLQKIPVISFSIPNDITTKKNKNTRGVESGDIKKKNEESNEWSTCYSSIEKMRDTALDSEWCPDLLARQLSPKTEIIWDVSEHVQDINTPGTSTPIDNDESIPPFVAISSEEANRLRKKYAKHRKISVRKRPNFDISPIKGTAQSGHYYESLENLEECQPVNLSWENISEVDKILIQNSDEEHGKIHGRKRPNFDISPIKDVARSEHYYETLEDLEEFQPVNLSSCKEVAKLDEIRIQNCDDQTLNEFHDSIRPVFIEDNLPSINEWLIKEQDGWIITNIDPVTSDPVSQNSYLTHSKERKDHRKKKSTSGVKKPHKVDSNLQKNSKLKNSRASETPHQKNETKAETKSAFTKHIDIYEFQEESFIPNINKKTSIKSTGNNVKRKIDFQTFSDDTGNSLIRETLIKKHKDELKNVPICCLTTLKCSFP